MTRTSALGRIGEQVATRHLERQGMVVVERNWRCSTPEVRGEIDLIGWDGAVLVFCEVKARRGDGAGGPLAAVTPRKQQRLRRLAAAWLQSSGIHADQVRFDAVGVCWPSGGGRARVIHVPGIG